jgi:hypothetical protein
VSYIEEEQTTQWSKEKVQKDTQRSTNHTYKTKDRVIRTSLKTGAELRYSGMVSSSCSTRAAPAYGVYISQLIGYSRACGSYQDFLDRGLLLTTKVLNQGFIMEGHRLYSRT